MHLRLVLTAGTILGCFAVLFFLAMLSAYRVTLEEALRKRLAADARAVVAAAQWEEGSLVISERLDDARFDQVESDFIAFIHDSGGNLLWHSASAGDFLPTYQPRYRPEEKVFTRFETRNEQPDYYLYDLDFELGGKGFSVVAGDDARDLDANLRTYRRQLGVWLTASIGALLLVVIGGLLWALKPLHRFREQMRSVEKGELTQLDENYPAEIQPLARGLNKLLGAERSRQERFQANIADLAHGLKTPLATIADTADMLSQESRRVLMEQVQHMNQLITYHLQRVRSVEPSWAQPPLPLAPVLERLCSSLEKIYRHKRVSWSVRVNDISLRMAEGQVLELFGNLVENAFRLCISRVSITAELEAEQVRLTVSDDGPGLSQARTRELLTRGLRADHRLQGQGIGLAVVMDMVDELGGGLDIVRADMGGAGFVVYLPLSALPDSF